MKIPCVPKYLLLSALLLVFALALLGTASAARADNDDLSRGEFIPTGVHITPTAAPGSIFQPLNPDLPSNPSFTAGQAVTTAVSPDGKTLLILTSGYNSENFTMGPKEGQENPDESNEYVFVFDISGSQPLKKQALEVPNALDGVAWNPNGREFYVAGWEFGAHGFAGDFVYVFDHGNAGWSQTAKIALGHAPVALGGILPAPAGLGVTADGKKIVVANFEHDSISLVDVAGRIKTAELDLRPGGGIAGGEFPFWVAIQGNKTAYVISQRDREVDVVDISTPMPSVTGRIPLKGQPNRLILNRKQTLLFVAEGSSDSVAVISTKSMSVVGEFGTTAPQSVFANRRGYKGSSPNSLALSPDEYSLYVTNGGGNSVAVIRLQGRGDGGDAVRGEVAGLIPTGWYPNSVSVSADGYTLYVVNGKSNAGPNPQGCRDKGSLLIGKGIGPGAEAECNGANQYIWQLTKAGFLTIPLPQGEQLENLTAQVVRNNGYGRREHGEWDDSVLAELRKNVKHVIYIIKENRTYDQILGDLGKGNGDPTITVYPQAVTPNQHALADRFVDLDNFYDSSEVSGDGWNWTTSGRAADTIEKTEPINYAGRGVNYDYEGTNRNINVGFGTVAERQAANPLTPSDPNLFPGTADVSAPDSPEGEQGAGYLWDSALRAGLTVRNYGFFVDLTRYSPLTGPFQIPLIKDPFSAGMQVAYAAKAALQGVTDPYYRGYDNAFPDFYRVNEWLREFDLYEQNGDLPQLEFVRIMHDHTGSFGAAIDGVDTPEIQTADNDYALGRIVDVVSHSRRYKDNTLIFVIEDDAQDGPDHMDAHRSIAFVAGAYIKQGAVISKRLTTVSMVATIVDILGIEHLGLYDANAEPMTDCFQTDASNWAFDAIVPEILMTSTTLPLPGQLRNITSGRTLFARYSKPLHDAAWWANQTRGFDFSSEDRVNAALYNRILWKGIMGDARPYPDARSGADLRRHRKQLLKEYRKTLEAQQPEAMSGRAVGGG
jgi:DNA-binding beta-propeller fold protein YncE